MAASPIDIYRRQIEKELQTGNATEHTHRPAAKTLIESLSSLIETLRPDDLVNATLGVGTSPNGFRATEKDARGLV